MPAVPGVVHPAPALGHFTESVLPGPASGDPNAYVMFLIRARFVHDLPARIATVAENGFVYLGKRGQWCALEKALQFRTRAAAEASLDEKWDRLRRTGDRDVILSVVPLPSR